MNSPAIRFNSFVVTDGNNNVPQPNDTINVTGTFKNYLDATTGLTAVITTTSAAVTILNGSSTLGQLPHSPKQITIRIHSEEKSMHLSK